MFNPHDLDTKRSCNNPNGCCGGSRCGRTRSSADVSTSSTVVAPPADAPSVALPKRSSKVVDDTHSNPVWTTETLSKKHASRLAGLLADDAPLPSKCDRHSDIRDGVCCKDLKGEDERTLIDPDIVRDVIIGLSDGLTVPFALTAGLSGLGDSRLVVLGGLAELIAGAISMGIGGYLASEAERDHFRYLRRTTRERVARSCEGEMEREVHAVLGPVGVDENLSRLVAENLRVVEEEIVAREPEPKPSVWRKIAGCVGRRGVAGKVAKGVADEEEQLRWSEDVGLTSFLLKFGEGMEEVSDARMWISAITIGLGYAIGGFVPLFPYFFMPVAQRALIASIILTGIVLLIFGAFKTHFTGATGGIAGYAKGAFSMLLVGGLAASAAFGMVKLLEA